MKFCFLVFKVSELFADTQKELESTSEKLTITTGNLDKATTVLTKTKTLLRQTEKDRDENAHLLTEHVSTETQLYSQAEQVGFMAAVKLCVSASPILSVRASHLQTWDFSAD